MEARVIVPCSSGSRVSYWKGDAGTTKIILPGIRRAKKNKQKKTKDKDPNNSKQTMIKNRNLP